MVSTSGENLETTFDLPDDLPAMMESILQQVTDQATALMVPFPNDRVGAGASWTATSSLEFNGIEILQVAIYSLDALEGDDYRISVDLEQTFEPGPAHGFDLKSGTGESHGSIQGSTKFLTPKTSTATSFNEIIGETGGDTVEVGTRIEMELRSGPP